MDGTHACHSSAVYAVLREMVTPVWLSTSLDNCSELACRFSSTLLIRRRSWRGVNFRGRPGRLCEMVAVPSFLNVCTTFATVFWLISKANLFGLGLDSDSNLFGLGLVLDSTKVDLTTALICSLRFCFAPETFSGVYSFLHHPNLSKTENVVL